MLPNEVLTRTRKNVLRFRPTTAPLLHFKVDRARRFLQRNGQELSPTATLQQAIKTRHHYETCQSCVGVRGT